MELKKLRQNQEDLHWPQDSNDLPVVDWETFQTQSVKRPLILISGFIHDVLLTRFIGKDATSAFFGGIYEHSNAAHNVRSI
jgi:stearoyl-CoA desaturase (Delta-9 desaturase)